MAQDNTIPHGKPGIASFESESWGNKNEPLFGDGITRTVSRSVTAGADLDLPLYSVISLIGGVIALAISGTAAGSASGTLTIANAVPADDDVFTINGQAYTFQSTLSTGPTVAYEVKVGADIAATRANLIAAINGTGTEGTEYSVGTVQNPDVYAAAGSAGVTTIIARDAGDEGNAITLTKTFATGANGSVSGATLTGGDDDEDIRPYGVLAAPIVMTNGDTMDVPIYVDGHWDQDALTWDATYVTDEQKQRAFEGSVNPGILVSKRKYNSDGIPA
jgi:hypothetical protein